MGISVSLIFVALALFAFKLLKKGVNEMAEANKPVVEYSGEVEANEGYESILVEYDDGGTFVEENTIDFSSTGYKWGANLTSIYAYLEGGDTNVIGAHAVDASLYDETVKMLRIAYDIKDRDSAEEVIDRMITYGHQSKYRYILQADEVNEIIKAIQRDYGDDFSFEEVQNINEKYFEDNGVSTEHYYTIMAAACAYSRFGEDALIGYDYIRLARVVFLSYQVGYITREECIGLLTNMEKHLQEQYSSFKDIHECYFYGEIFRLGEVEGDHTDSFQEILDAIDRLESNGHYKKIEKEFNTDISF